MITFTGKCAATGQDVPVTKSAAVSFFKTRVFSAD